MYPHNVHWGLAWEASTLPLSYTRPNRIYFSPKNDACKGGVLASLKPEEDGHAEFGHLIEGYKLCAGNEGKRLKSFLGTHKITTITP